MAARKVDARKTRKALKKLRRAVDAAERKLSDWEKAFADSVESRLETYGSAFTDGAKGRLDEPLSARQAVKVTEIARKGRANRKRLERSGPLKAKRSSLKRSGFKSKGGKWTPRVRRLEDEPPGDDG